MKASLRIANPRVMTEPGQVGVGQEVTWASRRPSRSQTLNTKKQPTGTKYLNIDGVSNWLLNVSP